MDKENIFDFLCCPNCKSELVESDGKLGCLSCCKEYEINNGIPILVDLENLPEHLAGQIKYFENEKITETKGYELEPWQESYIRRFSDNFGDIKGKIVIDCGTGSGYMAVELAKKGALVIACDLTLHSLIRLALISRELGIDKNMVLACCSAEDLPFKDGMADYFISNAVLEHLPKEKQAISEIDRVTKNDSGLMITVPISYKYLNPLLIPINMIHDKRIGHLRRYDKHILKSKLNNWKIISIYYTGHFKKVMGIIVNAIVPIFNYEKIEKDDNAKEKEKLWSSNVVCFCRKNIKHE